MKDKILFDFIFTKKSNEIFWKIPHLEVFQVFIKPIEKIKFVLISKYLPQNLLVDFYYFVFLSFLVKAARAEAQQNCAP